MERKIFLALTVILSFVALPNQIVSIDSEYIVVENEEDIHKLDPYMSTIK